MSLLNLLIDLLMDDMFDSYTFKSVLVSAHCPSNCMTQLTIRKFFVPLTALHFFSIAVHFVAFLQQKNSV